MTFTSTETQLRPHMQTSTINIPVTALAPAGNQITEALHKETLGNHIYPSDHHDNNIRTLMMGTATVPETSVLLFNHMTQLITQ